MIARTSIPISDYPKAKAFYTKVLATLGYTNNMEYGEAAGFNDGKNTDFWIGTPTASPSVVGDSVFDVKAVFDSGTILDSFDAPITISYAYTDDEIAGLGVRFLRFFSMRRI